MLPRYYEFYNPVKINAGKEALETIPHELKMLSANRPIIITDKGIVKAGAIVVPINTLLNRREVAYILKDAGAKGLIYHNLFSDAVTALREDVKDLSLFICIGESHGPASDIAWTDIITSTAALPEISFKPTDPLRRFNAFVGVLLKGVERTNNWI